MRILVLCLLVCGARIVFGAYIVPVNPWCPLSDDIISIIHEPRQNLVRVKYSLNRRCAEPSLILRLSGTALYMLKYEGMVNTTQFFRYPQLVDSGRYFLESFVLFCEQFQASSPVTQCFENFHHGKGVMNRPYSFTVTTGNQTGHPHPRWKSTNTVPVPLPTRYQRLPSEAVDGKPCTNRFLGEYCHISPDESAGHLAYNWTDGPQWQIPARAVYTKQATPSYHWKSSAEPTIFVCFAGDSHSYGMYLGLVELATEQNITWLVPRTINWPFPILFNTSAFDESYCSIVVVSFVIWPLCCSPSPFTQQVQVQELTRVFRSLSQYTGPAKVFFRSENINGLGAGMVERCPWGRDKNPPSRGDRRSPPAFDAMNAITRQMCEQRGVPFIDLDHVSYPMWDSGLDYTHPPQKTFTAGARHVLNEVFTRVIERREMVTTYPSDVHVPPPVTHRERSAMLALVVDGMCQRYGCPEHIKPHRRKREKAGMRQRLWEYWKRLW